MDLFVYSDESGVFDKEHNEIYVFGGLVFLGKEEKDDFSRRYLVAEKAVRGSKYTVNEELKACRITNKEKGKLYRAMNHAIKFGVVINQRMVLERIFQSKKDKQRYLDYAYKIALKRAFQKLIEEERLKANEVKGIHIFNDEHSTATNGRYELREALEQEFKLGTYNAKYEKFYPPIFDGLEGIGLKFCDSKSVPLVRAADIVANRIFYMALNRKIEELKDIYLVTLP